MRVTAWRVVEAQHQVSTRKLVDSDAEQQLLEQMIDSVKPPAHSQHLHYLLFTPFRYPPLKHGSRFSTRETRGVWYGAEDLRTCLAEVAHYRFLFLDGTSAQLGLLVTEHTAYSIDVATERGIDLTRKPFNAHRAAISNPDDYGASQLLGADMRDAGVAAFRWYSARDRETMAFVWVCSMRQRLDGERRSHCRRGRALRTAIWWSS